jgi:hypothetical protein
LTSGLKRLAVITAGFAIAIPALSGGPPQDGRQDNRTSTEQHERAEQELEQQEKQRILGIVPNFNTSFVQDAAPLSPGQKFRLALRGAIDPFTFVASGIDAGLDQAGNGFAGYGQGAQGYAKRFGASYADSFSGSMFGGALFPSLLHQDPRYFRKGTGSFGSRFFYALSTTVRTRNDNGRWAPNYSNIFGTLAADALANVYYPASDRGAGLTFERMFTEIAEGAVGTVFFEFWPDISSKLSRKRQSVHAPGSNAGSH